MEKKREAILIIDDEKSIHTLFNDLLKDKGYRIVSATSGEEGISRARESRPSVVLLDLNLPGMDGMEVLRQLKEQNPDVVVIMITGFGTVETAVRAMKMGAYDYIAKPFRLDEFMRILDRALKAGAMQDEISHLKSELKERYSFVNIVGKSSAMQRIYDTIQKVSRSVSTVLIQGNSGTGKELVARAIHYNSSRSAKPFVAVNCAALPDGLLESELFGYEKGSFTGAYGKKEGKFELADHGTILLDEISELSPVLQAKLLRVIQEKEVDPIGSRKPVKVDVRIIATTNQSLEKMIEERKFREDLYYRLNVVSIQLPPLNERKEDLPLLIRHFLEKFNKENDRSVRGVSEEAMKHLTEYTWPGNVRELEHTVEKAVVMGEGDMVLPEHLPLNICSYADKRREKITFDIGTPVDEVERQLLMATLQKTRGDRAEAASLLKISLKSLGSKLSKYKLGEDRGDSARGKGGTR